MNFDLQPTLYGELLNLRPLKETDFEDLFAVSSDPLIWEQHPERTRYQRPVFEKFFQAAMESRGALLALDALTDEVIGTSRFTSYVPNEKRVEVGYTFLARRCWSGGYSKEMKRLMLGHAFQYVERVLFYIGENNLRSRRAVEKIGAHLIERIDRKPRDGADYVATVYAIDRAEFLARGI